MSRISNLERLQNIDQELDEKTNRAHQIEEQLVSDPAGAAARAAFEADDRKLADLRALLRAREMDGKEVDSKTRQVEERLYSGRVSNPKELEGMEKDLQMHRRQRSQLDDQILEFMEAVDQAQKRASASAEALKKIQDSRSHQEKSLSHERDICTARITQLASEREHLEATLDPDALRTYDRLRRTKGSRAVASIRAGACGVCGVAVPTGHIQRAHSGSEIVFCSGCGRILAG
jgi:predicted  nucleic acid-binding Zn-ribbon protein